MYGANVQEGRRDSTVECGVSMAGGASPGEGVRGWEGGGGVGINSADRLLLLLMMTMTKQT